MGYSLKEYERGHNIGKPYEAMVVQKLREEGLLTEHTDTWCRKESEDRRKFETSPDALLLPTQEALITLPVEVKAVDKKDGFTDDPRSWPYEDVLVCNATKRVQLFAVVFVCQKSRSIVVAMNEGDWYEKPQPDPRREIMYQGLFCSLDSLVSWNKFIQQRVPQAYKDIQGAVGTKPYEWPPISKFHNGTPVAIRKEKERRVLTEAKYQQDLADFANFDPFAQNEKHST